MMASIRSEEKSAVFEKDCFSSHFQSITYSCIKRLLDKNKIDLNNKTILIAGCGIGRDEYYLEKYYSSRRVVFSDIDQNKLTRAVALFPHVLGVLCDNQQLGFKDNSIDYVIVGTSLHHLKMPMMGLLELLRISKNALIVNEPNDSWLTRLFEKLGLAQEYEVESGNYVYRFKKNEVAKTCKSLFLKYDISCFFAVHRIAKSQLEFLMLRILNALSNFFFPNLGNHIIFVIKKDFVFPSTLHAKRRLVLARRHSFKSL